MPKSASCRRTSAEAASKPWDSPNEILVARKTSPRGTPLARGAARGSCLPRSFTAPRRTPPCRLLTPTLHPAAAQVVIGHETTRVAALLSFLPRHVDLEKLMRLHQSVLLSGQTPAAIKAGAAIGPAKLAAAEAETRRGAFTK